MSIYFWIKRMSVAKRIKEERERLGHSQDDWAAHAGIHRNTQVKYERGDSFPDVRYLSSIEELGVDFSYIVTGERSVTVTASEALERQSGIVFNVVKDFEIVYEKSSIELDVTSRARVIAILYRLAYSTGTVDHKTIYDVITLAK